MSTRMSTTRRTSRAGDAATPNQKKEVEEDVLLHLLSILARGTSHHYAINGDNSASISLCKMLGFFSTTDYYAYLVSRGLATYKFHRAKKTMEIDFLISKWTGFLRSERYGLYYPENVEITITVIDLENLISRRTQRESHRVKCYIIRLGQRSSSTYAPKIGRQQIFLPTIPGWRAKQRYLRRLTNEVVVETLINNEAAYNAALDELDTTSIEDPSDDKTSYDDIDEPPTHKKQRTDECTTVPDNEPTQSYWRGFVGAAITKAAQPFRGMFPFSNTALQRQSDFDLTKKKDSGEVDKFLTDFVAMKQQQSGNQLVLEFKNGRNFKKQTFVKIRSSANDKSHRRHDGWIDECLEVMSRKDGNPSNSIRQLTASLLKRDAAAVLDAVKGEPGVNNSPTMDTIAEAAMWRDGNVKARSAQRVIRRHLRHALGKDIFSSERKFMTLTKGHSPVTSGHILHVKNVSEKPERIDYWIKTWREKLKYIPPPC